METAQSAPGPASAPDDDGAGPAVLVAASESMSSSRTTLAQEEEDEYGNNETVSHGLFAMGRCIAPPSRGEPAVSGCLIPAPSSQLWVLGRTTAVLCIEGEGTGSDTPAPPIFLGAVPLLSPHTLLSTSRLLLLLTGDYIGPRGGIMSTSARTDELAHTKAMSYKVGVGLDVPFQRLVYLDRYHVNVGWTPGSSRLVLLTAGMKLVSYAEAPSPVYSAICNPQTQDLMTGGDGEIIVWILRRRRTLQIREHVLERSQFPLGMAVTTISTLICDAVNSKQQTLFAACGLSVLVLNMSGKIVNVLQAIHARVITSLLYDDETSVLATGSGDGTIKLWDGLWQLLHVFVGHTEDITGMVRYPYQNLMMSSSLDGTIRVWNLKTLDSVMCVEAGPPILAIGMLCHKLRFYSLSHEGVQLWQINHIHSQFTAVGETVSSAQRFEQLVAPARILALSRDNQIRLISPVSGDVLTSVTELVQSTGASGAGASGASLRIVATTYSSALDFVYCLMQNGGVRVYDSSQSPARFIAEWASEGAVPNVLAFLERKLTTDQLGAVEKAKAKVPPVPKGAKVDPSAPPFMEPGMVTGEHVALLLLGTCGGSLQARNGLTGAIVFSSPQIHTNRIMAVVVNVEQTRLVTVGLDLLIQIWSIGDASKCEIVQTSAFFVGLTPCHVAITSQRFAIVHNDEHEGDYPLVMYDTETKALLKHTRHHDHVAVVSALCSCPTGWFATAALDGHVKLWSERNVLLRELDLYDPVSSCVFLNHGGTLGIGVQYHLHSVPCRDFLPPGFIKGLQVTGLASDRAEFEVRPSIEATVTYLSPAAASAAKALQERELLRRAAAAELSEELSAATAAKDRHTTALIDRDTKIAELIAKRNRAKLVDTTLPVRPSKQAIRAFMKTLYPNIEQTEGLRQRYNPDQMAREPLKLSKKEMEYFSEAADRMPDAIQGPSASLYYQWVVAFRGPNADGRNPPVAPDGFIPNSVIWQKMKEFGVVPSVAMGDVWTPPTFSDEQLLATVEESDDDEPSGLMAMALAEAEESEVEEPEPEPTSPPVRKATRRTSEYTAKTLTPPPKRKVATPPPTPPREPTPPPRDPTPPPREPTPPPKPKLSFKMAAKVVSLVQRPPLPPFISQFRDYGWFNEMYKHAHGGTFDFLRPPSDDPQVLLQVTLQDWLRHLISIEPENSGFGDTFSVGVGLKRRGVLWKYYYGANAATTVGHQHELIQGVLAIVEDQFHSAKMDETDAPMIFDSLGDFLGRDQPGQTGQPDDMTATVLNTLTALSIKDKSVVVKLLGACISESPALAAAGKVGLARLGLDDDDQLAQLVLSEKRDEQGDEPNVPDLSDEFIADCMAAYQKDAYMNVDPADPSGGAVDKTDWIAPLRFWLKRERVRRNPPKASKDAPPPMPMPTRNAMPTERFVLPQIVAQKSLPRIGYFQMNRQTEPLLDLTRTESRLDAELDAMALMRRPSSQRRSNSGNRNGSARQSTPGPAATFGKRRPSLLMRMQHNVVSDGLDQAAPRVPFSLTSPGRFFSMPDGGP